MLRTISKTVAALAFALLPMTASAAVSTDLNAGDEYLVQGQIASGTTSDVFTFTALERLKVNNITVVGVGSSGGLDLAKIGYTLSAPMMTGGLDTVVAVPFTLTRIGFSTFTGGYFSAGQSFTIAFNAISPVTNNVNLSVDMLTSPVPVPAAGLMLLAALGGAAALRRRQKSAVAA